jgi:hypothetical protein
MKDLTLRFHSIEHRRDEPAVSAARLVRARTARLEQSYQQLCALRPHLWAPPEAGAAVTLSVSEVRPTACVCFYNVCDIPKKNPKWECYTLGHGEGLEKINSREICANTPKWESSLWATQ